MGWVWKQGSACRGAYRDEAGKDLVEATGGITASTS